MPEKLKLPKRRITSFTFKKYLILAFKCSFSVDEVAVSSHVLYCFYINYWYSLGVTEIIERFPSWFLNIHSCKNIRYCMRNPDCGFKCNLAQNYAKKFFLLFSLSKLPSFFSMSILTEFLYFIILFLLRCGLTK
jgi:hypothetical protein